MKLIQTLQVIIKKGFPKEEAEELIVEICKNHSKYRVSGLNTADPIALFNFHIV